VYGITSKNIWQQSRIIVILGVRTLPGKCQLKQQWNGYLLIQKHRSFYLILVKKSPGNPVCWSIRHRECVHVCAKFWPVVYIYYTSYGSTLVCLATQIYVRSVTFRFWRYCSGHDTMTYSLYYSAVIVCYSICFRVLCPIVPSYPL